MTSGRSHCTAEVFAHPLSGGTMDGVHCHLPLMAGCPPITAGKSEGEVLDPSSGTQSPIRQCPPGLGAGSVLGTTVWNSFQLPHSPDFSPKKSRMPRTASGKMRAQAGKVGAPGGEARTAARQARRELAPSPAGSGLAPHPGGVILTPGTSQESAPCLRR